MKSTLLVALISLLSLFFSGCGVLLKTEEDLYLPGGALADKVEGPAVLATATAESIGVMFPVGKTSQAQVRAALGTPSFVTQSSDGTSLDMFSYQYTQFRAQRIRSASLSVTYDANRIVKETTFSANDTTY
jgi:hypothetical protein